MGEEQRPDSGKEKKSGFSPINAMHIVIIIGVIVLAAIFIAKFGFGTDLISPASGEMAIVKRPVTPVQTLIQSPVARPTVSFRPETLCPANQSLCGNSCTNRMTDTENCGLCGRICPTYNSTERLCTAGKCSNPCMSGYYDCNQNMADGCESDLNDNDNCGSCGKGCSSGMRCGLHQCLITGSSPEPYVPPRQL